jgi:hypothetical protein
MHLVKHLLRSASLQPVLMHVLLITFLSVVLVVNLPTL